MNEYCVYKHTSPSGKVYIGITKQTPESRWKNGRAYSHQRYLFNAIEKYGWDNFKHEVLFSGLTREEASAKEIELIAKYKSNQRAFGYNIEGGGVCDILVSDESRRRMRESHLGKKLSEKHRRRISEGGRGHCVSEATRRKLRESNIGKTMSAESKAKMSQSHRGLKPSEETVAKWRTSNQSLMTPVEQVDIETNSLIARFDSTMEAYRNTGVNSSTIVKCCRGKRKTAGGFGWRYVIETRVV